MPRRDLFLLPGGWTKSIRSGALHAVSLAFMALTRAWGSGATSRRRTTRLLAEVDRANTEIALLKEELSIKDGRWSRVSPKKRPYHRPVQRMRILKLKAARGWSASQAAGVFGVTQETITSWLMRVDEEGERALVQQPEPVNKLPEFVGYLVRWRRTICPTMGKVRIAQILARAGLRLGATTVRLVRLPRRQLVLLMRIRGILFHFPHPAIGCKAMLARCFGIPPPGRADAASCCPLDRVS